ncbi:hypothetical protein FRC17_004741 [Serendipita sp. 399]|nr:hypothetical protein FRC17_004741 [Serendipita sp. 399]
MSSNLKASLPLNVDEDAELTDRFKDSALAITALFKHAQRSRRTAFAQGYTSCVSDLRDFIRSNVRTSETDKPLTVGAILDFLEGRQTQLLRDVDFAPAAGGTGTANAPSATKEKSTDSRQAKNSISTTIRTNNTSSRPRSPSTPVVTSPSSPTPQPQTPVREQSWSDVSVSEGARPTATTPVMTNWPEVSVLPFLPVLSATTYSTSLPSLGGKRKRDASIVEVDPRNATTTVHLNGTDHHLRRHVNGSRKRKGNSNKNKGLVHGGSEDWTMEMDDDGSGRDRKRIRG